MDELEMLVNADRMWTSIKTFAFVVGVGGTALGLLSYGAYNFYHAIKATLQDKRTKKQSENRAKIQSITGLDEIDFKKIHTTQEVDKKILYALKGMNVSKRKDALLPEQYSRN